jgi:hypothetical protein
VHISFVIKRLGYILGDFYNKSADVIHMCFSCVHVCFLIRVCFSRVQVIYPSNVAAVQTCGISTVSLVLSLVYNMALVRKKLSMFTYNLVEILARG